MTPGWIPYNIIQHERGAAYKEERGHFLELTPCMWNLDCVDLECTSIGFE